MSIMMVRTSGRFTLTPDGKSLAYVTSMERDDLWMLQGFHQPGW